LFEIRRGKTIKRFFCFLTRLATEGQGGTYPGPPETRAAAAEAELDARRRQWLAGHGIFEEFYGAAQRSLRAQQELKQDKAAQVAALEAHAKLMKKVYELTQARFDAGRVPIQDLKQAEFYHLEAEIWLERAKAP
jgi:hypothetical protein